MTPPEVITVHTVDEFIADVKTRVDAGHRCLWLEVDGQHFTAHTTPARPRPFASRVCECGQVTL